MVKKYLYYIYWMSALYEVIVFKGHSLLFDIIITLFFKSTVATCLIYKHMNCALISIKNYNAIRLFVSNITGPRATFIFS